MWGNKGTRVAWTERIKNSLYTKIEWLGCRTKKGTDRSAHEIFVLWFMYDCTCWQGSGLLGEPCDTERSEQKGTQVPPLLHLRSHSSSRLAWPTKDDHGYTVFPVGFPFQDPFILYFAFGICNPQTLSANSAVTFCRKDRGRGNEPPSKEK